MFLLASREDRIRHLVNKIKGGKGENEKKKTDRDCKKSLNDKKVKEKKIHIGWLHRSGTSTNYKQVRKVGGGTVRQILYTDDQQITVEFLIREGKRMFLPDGKCKFGDVAHMKMELGNFDQQSIAKFTDTEGNECSYSEYLRSRGLFASRAYVYLLTTSFTDAENSSKDGGDGKETLSNPDEQGASSQSSPSTPSLGIAGEKDDFATNEYEKNLLLVEYEEIKVSSFSEVVVRSVSVSRAQCYEIISFEEPSIQDLLLEDFDPLVDGNFNVVGISKLAQNQCFLQRLCSTTGSDDSCPSFDTPSASECSSGSVILHHPTEVWGYDENQLVLCVVTSYHNDPANAYYTVVP